MLGLRDEGRRNGGTGRRSVHDPAGGLPRRRRRGDVNAFKP